MGALEVAREQMGVESLVEMQDTEVEVDEVDPGKDGVHLNTLASVI